MSSTIQFREEQRFDQGWLRGFLILFGLFATYVLIQQLVLGRPFGDHPAPDWAIVCFVLLAYGLIILFFRAKLITRIDQDEIHVRFSPFYERVWKWSDVREASVVNYGFVGGWGYRLTIKYGTIYNTRGKYGLFVLMKDGRKFTIGTQKVDELDRFIDAFEFSE